MDPAKCVVLVPVARYVERACEDGLRELERRGYPVRRTHGVAAIDVARNQMASDALADGYDELMWIDPDVAFRPDDVDRLRGHGLPLVAGIYSKHGRPELAAAFLKGTTEVTFGEGGGLREILYAGFGFAYTHRALYDLIFQRLELPVCNQPAGRALVPFFAPSAVQDGPAGAWWYLAEDYSFCMRTRRVGVSVMADTTVRLGHVGPYAYDWEDAGGPRERRPSFVYRVPATAHAPAGAIPASPFGPVRVDGGDAKPS